MNNTMTTNLKILLERTAAAIESGTDLSDITSGESFETFVTEIMKRVAEHDPSLPQNVVQTGKLAFPDITVDGIWGVEVKYSNSGKWDSLGNSIFEGTSVSGLEEIFVLFGKKTGKKIEVRFDLYENCVTDVKVTHSPRFIISLEENKRSLFNDLQTKSYNEFKILEKPAKGKQIKDYFRKQLKPGDDVWWIDQEEEVSMPKIRTFNNLEETEQKKLMVEAFILFPEVLSSATTKYNRVAPYWLTQYQVYNPSLRDKFSASGKARMEIKAPFQKELFVPKIYGTLYVLSSQIKERLENPSDDFLRIIKEKWETDINSGEINSDNLVENWSRLIDKYGVSPSDSEYILPSDIFLSGLGWKSSMKSMTFQYVRKMNSEKKGDI
jgi:hypothetical protein